MISDVDWLLLERRLEDIERSIDMLKVMVGAPKNISCSLVEVDRRGNEYYVLKEGDLTQPGYLQQWRNEDGL